MRKKLMTLVASMCLAASSTGASSAVVPDAVVSASPGTPVICGDVLTSDVTLRADLICTGDVGLRVQGDVTINLNGHQLAGPGSQTGSVGILPEGDGAAITVRGGTVRGWGVGLDGPIGEPWAVGVQRVVFSGNGTAISLSIYNTSTIVRSRFLDNGTGLSLFYARATVDRSVFANNGAGADSGSSSGLSIARSIIHHNGVGVRCYDGSCANISRSVIKGNGTGLSVFLDGGSVSDTRFIGNRVGATMTFLSNVHFNNDLFRGNSVAIESNYEDNSDVRGSTFRRNGTGFRSVHDEWRSHATVVDNTFVRNTDGIYISLPSDGVGSGSPSVGGNLATHNTGWGIYAVGAIDLGGNVARHNGNEPQCVGVIC